jgi:YVTN family beta-propeller protein
MKSKAIKWSFFVGLVVLNTVGCKKENETEDPVPTAGSKIYVSNEGNFGDSNADVSYIDDSGVIRNDVFLAVNGVPLGDVLQSLTIEGNRAYAVMNNSNKVVVFNATTYAPLSVIDNITYPRHMLHTSNSKAYITAGAGEGTVYPLDKTSMTLGTGIAVGNGPEGMTMSNNHLYVCNSGGWGVDQTVSVIDLDTDAVSTTITLSDIPVKAVTDANGDVWVLCKGQTIYDEMWTVIGHTDAKVYHIDEMTNEVIESFEVGENGDHPESFTIAKDKQTLYVVNGGVYSMPINGGSWQLVVAGNFKTVDVSQKDGKLWLTGANGFVNPEIVYHYTTAGVLIRQFTAGIGANGVIEK